MYILDIKEMHIIFFITLKGWEVVPKFSDNYVSISDTCMNNFEWGDFLVHE